MTPTFDFSRFVAAQDPVLDRVRAELRNGRKATHWMWFVFPQLDGLARSATAKHYALHSLAEARAWLAHPLLGPRLLDCTGLVTAVMGRDIRAILGSPDDMKFHACMTLFAAAAPDQPAFPAALDRHYGGARHAQTLTLLAGA